MEVRVINERRQRQQKKKTHNIEGMEGGREERGEKGGCGEGKRGGQSSFPASKLRRKELKNSKYGMHTKYETLHYEFCGESMYHVVMW